MMTITAPPKVQASTLASISKRALVLAVANALVGQGVLAQESSGRSALEEVVVTATKREVSVQQVPLSVTAISGEELVDMQITNILNLEKVIPGLTIRSAGNNPSAIIRGAGSAGTSDIAVPFYIDGMYLPNTGQALASFVDLERVEGLRGPQGTLFGRNTFGGLINIITRKPEMGELDYGLAVTAGDYSLMKYEGMLNVPLGDSVAFRLVAADEERDPFVENKFNSDAGVKDSNYSYVRAQLRFEPAETLSINFSTSYWKDTANGNLSWGYKPLGVPLSRTDSTVLDPQNGTLEPRVGKYIGCPDGDRPGGGFQAGNICDGQTEALIQGDEFEIYSDITPQREAEETAYYLNIGWEVASHFVNFNAAMFDYEYFSFNDADFTSLANWGDGEFIETTNTQVDLAISSLGDGRLQYTVGLYYYDGQDDDNTYSYVFASLAETWSGYAGATPEMPSWAYWMNQSAGGTESKAIYAQADYSLTEKLNLTVGARYTEDDRESIVSNILDPTLGNAESRLFNANSPKPPSFDYTGAVPVSGDESHNDWRLGAEYFVTDEIMVYGSWATSYIAGSIDGTTGNLLDPQENETYEVGVKADLFDGSLRVNAAIYSAVYEGFSTTAFTIEGDGVPVARQVPGGGIDAQGIEIEGFWDVSNDLQLDFGIAYDDSVYNNFNVASRTGNEGVDFVDASGQGWFEMDGMDTPFSPDLTVSLGISYAFDAGAMGLFRPRLQTYYNSGYETAREATFFSEQDSYTKLDLSVNWESANGSFTARAYVNNLTDEVISTSTDITPEPDFTAYADYSAPRNYGLRLGYNF
tara:strand:+ start:62276 stop:64708 length:2433 start_codon:yes stop_codon:yes gene_type:complete